MRWMVLLSLISHFILLGVSSQQGSLIADAKVNYTFQQELTIQATFSSSVPAVKAQLNLQPQNGEIRQIEISTPVTDDLKIKIDLQKLPLPTFSRIYYWFVILFPDNTSYTSPSYWFDYIDNRFLWNSNSSKWFNLYWTDHDTNFGLHIQSLALDGLKNATGVLPVSPDLPVSIFVYPDAASLQDAISETTGADITGNAIPDTNAILVSSSDDLTNTTNLERQVPHELMHLLEYHLTGANYASAPAWLLEGLATNAENYKDPDQARALKLAFQQNSLIPLDQLCNAFPHESIQSTLAYAESASFTQFLTEKFGTDKMISLLQNAGNGLSCQQLILNTLGENLTDLESSWHQEVQNQRADSNGWLSYWPIPFVAVVLLIPLLLIRKNRQSNPSNGERHDRKQ